MLRGMLKKQNLIGIFIEKRNVIKIETMLKIIKKRFVLENLYGDILVEDSDL